MFSEDQETKLKICRLIESLRKPRNNLGYRNISYSQMDNQLMIFVEVLIDYQYRLATSKHGLLFFM